MLQKFCIGMTGLLLAGKARAQEALVRGNNAYRAGETVLALVFAGTGALALRLPVLVRLAD